jgi:hypothetical protein
MESKRHGIIITVLGTVACMGLAWTLFLPSAKAAFDLSGAPASQPATKSKLVETYGKLPLSFELNQGQSDQRVRYLARGSGYTLFLTGDSAVLALRKSDPNGQGQIAKAKTEQSQVQGTLLKSPASLQVPVSTSQMSAAGDESRTKDSVLWMKVVGADPRAGVSGQDELLGKSNYFIGNDPKKWHSNVPNYAEVKYASVYPGVDLIYYGNQGQLEYDFVVQPGADFSRIVLDVGVEPTPDQAHQALLQIAENGDLLVGAEGGQIILQKPTIYQPGANNGRRTADKQIIEGKYVLVGAHQVGFQVAAYDHSKPLVIDPTVVYSTYLGGNLWDEGNAIAVDASHNAYLTGKTVSADFPTTTGAFQHFRGNSSDAFVSVLNPTGTGLIYSTFLGGNNGGEGFGIALDASDNAYVTGWTGSSNFPTTVGALQKTFGGGYEDAFVSKLNPTGSALIYSTYLGGSSFDVAHGIAVDASGNAYVTGFTFSSNFPTTTGAFQSAPRGYDDAFVSKLNPTGSALIYSTYLGGNGYDEGYGIAVDASGDAYVSGLTHSSNFPVSRGAFQTTPGGGFDAFVSKLNAAGSGLIYSTYLGGGLDDFSYGIAIDASDNAYVTGLTFSSNFPTTAGAFQTTGGVGGGYDDAFVVKLNPAGTALVYSTYLGGSGDDAGYSIAVDALGNASVAGGTYSTNFPITTGAYQTTLSKYDDAFVSTLNPAGSALLYSTYLGGSIDDVGHGVAVDAVGDVYATGITGSNNLPTTSGSFMTTRAGVYNAFVIQITTP